MGVAAATTGRFAAVTAAAAVVAAGCGGGDAREGAPVGVPAAETLRVVGRGDGGGRHLERNGISLTVPDGWSGRVLFREPSGRHGVSFQVASFELPANAGLEPPRELPPGEEDPIKAMAAGDILVTITDGATGGVEAPATITVADLSRLEGPRVPGGHWLAARSFCFGRRCVGVEVDFGAAPSSLELQRADGVLASLVVT